MQEDATRRTGRRAPVRRGAVLLWVGILLFVFIGVVGLAIDWGFAHWTAQKLQNGADAAALAGARRVWFDHADARDQAIAIAAENEAGGSSIQLADNPSNVADGDVIIGHYDTSSRTFRPTLETGQTNAVLVHARRTEGSLNQPLPLFFGGIFGVPHAEITRWAIAVAEHQPAGPGIILLKSDGIGLKHTGEGDVTIHGTVQINSNYKEALHQSGSQGVMQADSYDVVGRVYDTNGTGLPGDWNEGVTAVPDPYASVPVPDFLNDPQNYPVRSPSKYTGSQSGGYYTLLPGRYIGGMDLGNNATYILQPGVYIIEGGGLKISTNPPAYVRMDEVMIYNCGTNGTTTNADQFYISGEASVTWTPVVGGTYDGFGLFQHRDLADKKVQISGNNQTNISAIIYAKTAEVQLSGNGTAIMLGGGFVAASMEISGNLNFEVGGNVNNEPGGEKVYLAE